MSEPIRVTFSDTGVATLAFSRPDQRNALDEATALAFSEAVQKLKADASVRAVIVAGEGIAFCAGGDLGMLQDLTRSSAPIARERMRRFYGSFLGLASLDVPVIAAIHGAAVGAGMALTLACDVRIVAADAKVGFNFSRLGIPPGMGTSFLLPRAVGTARATELLLSGRLLPGTEAVAMGLCHEVHPSAHDVKTRARTLADDLASAAPVAVRLTKEALRRDLAGLDAALAQEAAAQALAYGTYDLKEGVAAAMERRPPRFEGR